MKRTRLRRRLPLKHRGRRAKSWRKKLWPELSKLIRARDGQCLMGQSGFKGACAGPLQGSHIYPKGEYPLLELYPLNVKTLCFRHHRFVWHVNVGESWGWLCRTLPQAWIERLNVERTNSLGRKRMDENETRAEWRLYGLV